MDRHELERMLRGDSRSPSKSSASTQQFGTGQENSGGGALEMTEQQQAPVAPAAPAAPAAPRRRLVVSVVDIEADAHEDLLITHPRVKFTYAGKTQTVAAEVAQRVADDGARTLTFAANEKRFRLGQESEEVHVVVEDTDAHGIHRPIAHGDVNASAIEKNPVTYLPLAKEAFDEDPGDDVHLIIKMDFRLEDLDADKKAATPPPPPAGGAEERKGNDDGESSCDEDEEKGKGGGGGGAAAAAAAPPPPPNFLKVGLEGVANLRNEGRAAKDCNTYCVLTYGHGREAKKYPATPVREGDAEPMYCWTYYLPVRSDGWPDRVTLDVMDRRPPLFPDHLLGRIVFTPTDLQALWAPVPPAAGGFGGDEEEDDEEEEGGGAKEGEWWRKRTVRRPLAPDQESLERGASFTMLDNGTLEVNLEALYISEEHQKELAKTLEMGAYDSDVESDSDDDDGGEEHEESGDEGEEEKKEGAQEEEEEASKGRKSKAEKAEERRKMEDDLKTIQDVEIKPGDYTVTVHVIEVRGLVAEKKDDTPDPVLRVHAYGQHRSTAIKKDTGSAYFDDKFLFQLADMTEATLMDGHIRVECFDAGENLLEKTTLIGAWQTDFDFVFFKENHEYYRKWVPLMGKLGKNGVGGYLQVSVSIVGPGDKPVKHDVAAERKAELEAAQASGGGLKVDMPSTKQELHFLKVTIWKAEGLPQMDDSLVDGQGIDAFFRVDFGDCPAQDTDVQTVQAKKGAAEAAAAAAEGKAAPAPGTGLDPTFRQQLWIPFLSPCMSSKIGISLYDQNKVGKPELVASAENLHLEMVEKYPDLFDKRWLNLYGGLLTYPPLRAGAHHQMNKEADTASCYKGRVLVTLEVDENKRRRGKKDGKKRVLKPLKNKPKKKTIGGNKMAPTIHTHKYGLRFRAFMGSEMPVDNMKDWFQVQVHLGPHVLKTAPQQAKGGVCYWGGNAHERLDIELPKAEVNMFPDIFVYLVRNPGNRIPGLGEEIVSLLRYDGKTEYLKGLTDAPTWRELKEEPVNDAIKKAQHPGMLLMTLDFGDSAAMAEHPLPPPPAGEPEDYQARIYVFQGRNLPALDEDGTMDPYVKVMFGGKSATTQVQRDTKNPAWYECHALDVKLKPHTEIMPLVLFQLWDSDFGLANDDYAGSKRLPVTDGCVRVRSLKEDPEGGAWDPREAAQWVPLGREQEGDVPGELLVAVDLIRLDAPRSRLPKVPADLRPKTCTKYIEFVCLGCRDLHTTNPLGLKKPFMRFVLDGREVHRTKASHRPSPRDPNFKENGAEVSYHVSRVQLPVDPKFAGALTLECRDELMGGLQTPLVGSTYIPLEDRIEFFGKEPNKLYRRQRKLVPGNPFVDHEAEFARARKEAAGGGLEAKIKAKNAEEKMKRLQKAKGADEAVDASQRGPSEGGKGVKPKEETAASKEAAKQFADLGPAFKLEKDEVERNKPDWLHEREKRDDMLEQFMGGQPVFERFVLYTGETALAGDDPRDNHRRRVGVFKGVLRVLERPESKTKQFVQQLQRPVVVQCHLYVLTGSALAVHSGHANPYLKVKLGGTTLGDRKDALPGKAAPDFYKRFDFATSLPGTSQLKIDVWDRDLVFDERIGETVIDLEDRWFNQKWQGLAGRGKMPIETRALWSPLATSAQGFVTCWLDIYDNATARKNPPINIAPPPHSEYEVRVIVWTTKGIPPGDTEKNTTDMYISCRLGSDAAMERKTDTHLQATDGVGNFNWRMKFPITLPVTQEGGANLKIQVWDWDALEADDCLCESDFNFDVPFQKAAMFKDIAKSGFQVFYTKEETEEKEKQEQTQKVSKSRRSSLVSGKKGEGEANEAGATDKDRLLVTEDGKKKKTKKVSPTSGDKDKKDKATYGATKEEARKQEAKKKKKSSGGLWGRFQEQAGLGPDPPNSHWLPLEATTHFKQYCDPDQPPMVLVSVEVLTKERAEILKNGQGNKEEPNQFPYLPPPKGRIDFTKMFNPFYLIQTLCGAQNASRLGGACCCLVSLALLVIVGPTVFDIVDTLLLLPTWLQLVVAVAIGLCLFCGALTVARDFAAFCGCEAPCAGSKKKEKKGGSGSGGGGVKEAGDSNV